MVFYISMIGLGLIAFLLYISIAGAAPILTVSIVGLISFAVILIAIRRGWMRGRKREMIFACTLIVLYGLRSFLVTLCLNIYNLFYGVIVTQLNNRGVTTINVEKTKWVLDKTGQTAFEMMIFFAGTVVAYAFTSGKPMPKPVRDAFGGVLGGLNAALFLTYTFLILQPFLGGLYSTTLLEGVTIKLPQVDLPDLVLRRQADGSPFGGWERWLPIGLLVLVTVYTIFFVFSRPPTRTDRENNTKLDAVTIIGVAVLLAIVWRFAVIPNL